MKSVRTFGSTHSSIIRQTPEAKKKGNDKTQLFISVSTVTIIDSNIRSITNCTFGLRNQFT